MKSAIENTVINSTKLGIVKKKPICSRLTAIWGTACEMGCGMRCYVESIDLTATSTDKQATSAETVSLGAKGAEAAGSVMQQHVWPLGPRLSLPGVLTIGSCQSLIPYWLGVRVLPVTCMNTHVYLLESLLWCFYKLYEYNFN